MYVIGSKCNIYMIIYIYVYVYMHAYKLKKYNLVNVAAKAFISNDCSKSDGAYIKISKLQRIQNNSLSGSFLLQCVIKMC